MFCITQLIISYHNFWESCHWHCLQPTTFLLTLVCWVYSHHTASTTFSLLSFWCGNVTNKQDTHHLRKDCSFVFERFPISQITYGYLCLVPPFSNSTTLLKTHNTAVTKMALKEIMCYFPYVSTGIGSLQLTFRNRKGHKWHISNVISFVK